MAKFVDLPTAARRLGVYRTTLNRIVLAGGLPATRYGQRWLIAETDLERFEAKRLENPTPSPPGAVASPGRQEVLYALATNEGATVAELAVLVDCPKRSVLQWVQHHEQHGLIVRHRAPGPREPHHCWLTEAGRRAATRDSRPSPGGDGPAADNPAARAPLGQSGTIRRSMSAPSGANTATAQPSSSTRSA